MARMENCPTCGAGSGFGSDEDGYPDCHICGGPHRCPVCDDWVSDQDTDCPKCSAAVHEDCLTGHSCG